MWEFPFHRKFNSSIQYIKDKLFISYLALQPYEEWEEILIIKSQCQTMVLINQTWIKNTRANEMKWKKWIRWELRNRWNKICGRRKGRMTEETCPYPDSSTSNRTWKDLDVNSGSQRWRANILTARPRSCHIYTPLMT